MCHKITFTTVTGKIKLEYYSRRILMLKWKAIMNQSYKYEHESLHIIHTRSYFYVQIRIWNSASFLSQTSCTVLIHDFIYNQHLLLKIPIKYLIVRMHSPHITRIFNWPCRENRCILLNVLFCSPLPSISPNSSPHGS
jgi:hypothetical protein